MKYISIGDVAEDLKVDKSNLLRSIKNGKRYGYIPITKKRDPLTGNQWVSVINVLDYNRIKKVMKDTEYIR